MRFWSAVFLLIAIVAALFGFGNIAAGAVAIARILVVRFLLLFMLAAIIGLIRR